MSFCAIELLAPAVLLHDRRQHLVDPLVGGESSLAGLARPPPTNELTGRRDAGIDDAALEVAAEWAFHDPPLPGPAAPGHVPVLHVRSYDEAENRSDAFVPPKPNELLMACVDAPLASNVGHVVETALGVLVFEVDGRRYHPFGDRER